MLSLRSTNKMDYFIILLGILISGNPAFIIINKQVDLSLIAIVLLITIWVKKIPVTNKLLIVVSLFSLIFLVQSVRDGSLLLFTELGFIVVLFIAYALQVLVKNFPKVFVKVIFHLGILSLIFYVPAQIGIFIGVDFKSWFQWLRADLGELYFHIVIHNFRIASSLYIDSQEWRNAGLFWEPGAFSGYLLLALVFLSQSRSYFTQVQFKLYFTVLTLCLFTTFSTSGYLLFPIVYFAFFSSNNFKVNLKKRHKKKVFVMASFLVFILLVPMIMGLPFMKKKIENEISLALNADRSGFYGISRLGGFLFDYEFIKQKPLFGWGPDPTIRMKHSSANEEVFLRQGNGLTGFIIKFGFIGAGLYFYMLYRAFYLTFKDRVKSYVYVFFIALLLINEQFLNFPIFLSLIFLNEGNIARMIKMKNSKI